MSLRSLYWLIMRLHCGLPRRVGSASRSGSVSESARRGTTSQGCEKRCEKGEGWQGTVKNGKQRQGTLKNTEEH